MVAISLYRGNLHRVPDVPRRWPIPKPNISHKVFKTLLSRRSRALSRLNSPSSSNPNPATSPNLVSGGAEEEESPKGNLGPEVKQEPETLAVDFGGVPSGKKNEAGAEEEDSKLNVKPIVDSVLVGDRKPELPEGPSSSHADDDKTPPVAEAPREVLKVEEPGIPNPEVDKKDELLDDKLDEKLKRKQEVEDKLRVLKDKKHVLVQMLKQVLNAEEELNRRIAVQGVSVRPPGPLHGDPTNTPTVDSVSMTRSLTPRTGFEHELAGEGDTLSNQNHHSSRQIFRTNSASPSSESPIRRLPHLQQHNSGLHTTSRTSLGHMGSPSPFTLVGGGHGSSMPSVSVSVSGTNYIASSPSPAASGGTSTFRDNRLPSPWN